MTQHPKRLFLAGLLAASLGVAAVAQPPLTPPNANQPAAGEASAQPATGERRGYMKSERSEQKMAERHTQRMGALKEKLKLTPAQESAWNSYTAAMQPPARGARPTMDRAAFEKLSTPERIDRMQALQQERQGAMRQRGDAVKSFYAQLTPEQKKTFDAESLRHGPRGHRGFGHHGHHGGPGMHRS
ncbi:Spy/CpxP family protein refolding chaperone [bacterium BD-1]|nr:Spy/CpxP family protein refolding chaperone [Ottowia caeni]